MYDNTHINHSHAMLGEALIAILLSKEALSVGALAKQLNILAEFEDNEERILACWQARTVLTKAYGVQINSDPE